jgi:hypothetical protein
LASAGTKSLGTGRAAGVFAVDELAAAELGEPRAGVGVGVGVGVGDIVTTARDVAFRSGAGLASFTPSGAGPLNGTSVGGRAALVEVGSRP